MALETKKDRNGETSDVWETFLTRRLADDLDAFLEETNDETFFFADETTSTRRTKEVGKRLFYKTLATVAASAAFLCVAVSTSRLYIASSQSENGVESRIIDDEPSLLAWSVENLSEAPWARRLEATLTSADVWGLYAASTKETETTRTAADEESDATEVEASEGVNVETLSRVAASEPLKYEPFLQAIAASLL